MKKEYWEVSDEQLMDKSGKKSNEWMDILRDFGASTKKSNEVVNHLQEHYNLPRYWARTISTIYIKNEN